MKTSLSCSMSRCRKLILLSILVSKSIVEFRKRVVHLSNNLTKDLFSGEKELTCPSQRLDKR